MRLPNILNLSLDQRRRIRLGKKRGKYETDDRKQFTRNELIDFLRANNIHSIRQVEKIRKDGEPRMWDFVKEFGNWENAKGSTWGVPVITAPQNNAEYICKAVVQFDLWTARKYRALHIKRPDVVPSFYAMLKQFRLFDNLKNCARQLSLKKVLDDYLKLGRKLGRIPTFVECRYHGIAVDRAVDFFGSRQKLEAFFEVERNKKSDAGKTGSS